MKIRLPDMPYDLLKFNITSEDEVGNMQGTIGSRLFDDFLELIAPFHDTRPSVSRKLLEELLQCIKNESNYNRDGYSTSLENIIPQNGYGSNINAAKVKSQVCEGFEDIISINNGTHAILQNITSKNKRELQEFCKTVIQETTKQYTSYIDKCIEIVDKNNAISKSK